MSHLSAAGPAAGLQELPLALVVGRVVYLDGLDVYRIASTLGLD